jgi:hypothetical protein
MHLLVYADGKHYGFSLRNRAGETWSVGMSSLPGEKLPQEEARQRAEVQAQRQWPGEKMTFHWVSCEGRDEVSEASDR